MLLVMLPVLDRVYQAVLNVEGQNLRFEICSFDGTKLDCVSACMNQLLFTSSHN